MATVTKIDKDIAAAKAKIAELQKPDKEELIEATYDEMEAELQKKIRELETKRVEAENLQIVKLVKTVNIDNKTLTALLKAYATGEFELPEKYKAELENKEDADNENEQN